jgi:glucokinase
VVSGRLAQGLTGNLGQFGHLIVEPDGAPCACGAIGCLTVYAGAKGIEASTGRDLRRTPPAIVERTGIMVGRACASISAMLDVADIVIGGIVPSVFGAPFFDALAKELDQRSGLAHLGSLRVRGTGTGRVGPLVAAAAIARHAEAERAAHDRPESLAGAADLPAGNPDN